MSLTRKLLGGLAAICLALPVFAANDQTATQNPADQQQPAAAEQSAAPATATNNEVLAENKATTSININTADVNELASIKGLGQKRAQAIVSFREKNGPFKTVEDLTSVKGISKNFIKKNRETLTVG